MKLRKSKKMDLYEYTLEETAKELGCSPERVQQILNEAIAKIRRNPEHLEILREYMA
jgi:DNA-directed RNA polymerase sigma subunit (sigma70/sigma32)